MYQVKVHWVEGPGNHVTMRTILGTVLVSFLILFVIIPESSRSGSGLHPDLWFRKKDSQMLKCWQSTYNLSPCPAKFLGQFFSCPIPSISSDTCIIKSSLTLGTYSFDDNLFLGFSSWLSSSVSPIFLCFSMLKFQRKSVLAVFTTQLTLLVVYREKIEQLVNIKSTRSKQNYWLVNDISTVLSFLLVISFRLDILCLSWGTLLFTDHAKLQNTEKFFYKKTQSKNCQLRPKLYIFTNIFSLIGRVFCILRQKTDVPNPPERT